MHRYCRHLFHTMRFPTLLFAAALGWIGCGEDAPTNPSITIEPKFSSIQVNILDKNCTTSSCHSTLGQRGGLVLESNVAYANLVNVLPSNFTAQSKGLMRVTPGKPDSSFLFIKLTGPRANEGDRMPQLGDMLDEESIEAIREWITLGAKND